MRGTNPIWKGKGVSILIEQQDRLNKSHSWIRGSSKPSTFPTRANSKHTIRKSLSLVRFLKSAVDIKDTQSLTPTRSWRSRRRMKRKKGLCLRRRITRICKTRKTIWSRHRRFKTSSNLCRESYRPNYKRTSCRSTSFRGESVFTD